MRELDAVLEPFSRRQATSPAHVSRVRAVPGGETDLWLEPARAYERAHGRETRVHLPSLDSRHGVLGDPGALAKLGLGQAGPGPREIDEVAAVHFAMIAQKCTKHPWLPAIDLAPMGDPGDEHEALGVVDRVHDPVIAHPDPEVVATGELHCAPRTRVNGEEGWRSTFSSVH